MHDLDALRADPSHPGEEAPRDELVGLIVTRRGPPGAPRLCLNGHLDVVAPGAEDWRLEPWSGAVEGGFLHGRGSVDMKGAVVAALHALARVEEPGCEAVLQAVSAEEDGGLGAFAALEADARFDACLIPEPTGFDVVCAQAGALTFSGEVRGRGAHAALRLEGASAIDAYVEVHPALADTSGGSTRMWRTRYWRSSSCPIRSRWAGRRPASGPAPCRTARGSRAGWG